MIVRGIDVTDPGLGIPARLSPQAAALYPQIDTRCLPDLGKPDSFGSLPTSQLFRADADVNPIVAALSAQDDPEGLKIKTPVLIEQGSADTTAFPTFTQQLVADYLKAHAKVTYKTYGGVTHGGVVTSAKPQSDATAYIKKRLG
jgi:hypothetical protein